MRFSIICLIMVSAFTNLVLADIYKYTDADGRIYYTEEPRNSLYSRIIKTIKPFDEPTDEECNTRHNNFPSSWIFEEKKDEMNDALIQFAYTPMINDKSHANIGTLSVRVHPRLGIDIFISIGHGEFVCSEDNCVVLARFDDSEPVTYEAISSNDGGNHSVFIKDTRQFISKLKCSNKLQVEATIFNKGPVVMKFIVSGLTISDEAFHQKRASKNKKH